MIPLNEHELSWLNHNRHLLNVPKDSSIAAEVFVAKGVEGVARLHKAIIARDIKKIQRLLDN